MRDFDLTSILLALETDGHVVVEQFLADDMIDGLREFVVNAYEQQLTRKALTGLTKSGVNNIRGDHIIWLDDTAENTHIQQYLKQMNVLKNALNQAFYLNLHLLESHFAIYPIGSGYAKHLDQFHAQKTRKISSVLYLNKNWQAVEGGCLRLYLSELENSDIKYRDIQPLGGSLVLFESERFFHEVLVATRERVSIAGWFKTRE